MTTTSTAANDSCPRIEEIAALIDGRLARKEHEELTAHLGECESCYELFSETLRYQLEEKPATAVQVVPHPAVFTQRPAWITGLAVAAAALIAGIFVVPRPIDLGRGLDPTLPAGALVAEITRDQSASMVVANAYNGEDWFRTRGGAIGTGAKQPSFRLGVRTVDFEAALRSGNLEAAERFLIEVMETARGLPASEAALSHSEDLLKQLRQGEGGGTLSRGSAEIDRLLAEIALDPLYTFGKWAEAGLLAVSIGGSDVLASQAFRDFPTRLEQEELPADITDSLDRAEDLLAVQPLDMAGLEEVFHGLVSRGGNL